MTPFFALIAFVAIVYIGALLVMFWDAISAIQNTLVRIISSKLPRNNEFFAKSNSERDVMAYYILLLLEIVLISLILACF